MKSARTWSGFTARWCAVNVTRKASIRRRSFLGAGLGAAGVAAVSCGRKSTDSPYRFFTAEEGAAVDAVCEALIPTDRDPGAHTAAAVNYIDIQLATRFKKHRRAYREGIAAIDRISHEKCGKPFAALKSEEQTAVLQAVEEQSRDFFDLVLAHTRQGFYGDPRHGGNRHMVSWKMVGLPYPPVRGRMHYDEGPKAG